MKKTFYTAILFYLLLPLINLNAQRLDNGTSSSKDLITLIVIAHEQESIKIADIIRQKTRQPTLIYQSDGAIFIGAHNKAIKIALSDVPAFVRFAHPRYILAFSSPQKLPIIFLKALKPRLKSYLQFINTTNWNQLTLQIDKFFSTNKITTAFLNSLISR